jgi:integral membrane protein (TIGR01906 family)
MTRWSVVSFLVAVAVFPLVSIGALRIVTQPWIVHFEVDHGGLPADRYGFDAEDRRRLGLIGLEAIRPGGKGISILRETRLPDGKPAFGARELRHMQDVRTIVGVAFRTHTALLVFLVLVALLLARHPRGRVAVPRGLRLGAIGSTAVAAIIGLLMLVAWDAFFTGFHRLFFSGRTWWFYADDTLRRVYPDAFWMGVGAWIAGIAVGFTAVVFLASSAWLRRIRRKAGGGAGTSDAERVSAA